MPVRYERDEQGPGAYKTKVRKSDRSKHWSFGQLRTREDPLVIFTLISQAVVGAFLTLFLGPRLGYAELSTQAHPLLIPTLLFLLLGAQTFALVLSTMHLGKPHRFYRAFNNLRYSPVSREVAGIAVFYNLLGAYALIAALPELVSWLPTALAQGIHAGIGWLAVVAGPTALYFMYRIYRIPARPFWNHWQTLSAFFGNMLALGPMLVGTVVGIGAWAAGIDPAPLLSGLAVPIAAGLALRLWVSMPRHEIWAPSRVKAPRPWSNKARASARPTSCAMSYWAWVWQPSRPLPPANPAVTLLWWSGWSPVC